MIEVRRVGSIAMLLFAAWLSGCGGCQDQTPKAAPAPQAPAATNTAAKPSRPAAPPTQPPPAPATLAAAEQEAEAQEKEQALEDDCFVMMDAFPDYGPPPLKVKFTSEVECNSGKPTFKWTFGDGSAASTEANPTHSYEKEGEFVASVTVTGPSGGSDTDEMDIIVEKEGKEGADK